MVAAGLKDEQHRHQKETTENTLHIGENGIGRLQERAACVMKVGSRRDDLVKTGTKPDQEKESTSWWGVEKATNDVPQNSS
jgi:hypothetical protein